MAQVTLTPMPELMVCPGETVTFTCEVTGDSVTWAVSGIPTSKSLSNDTRSSAALAPFMLEVTEVTPDSGTVMAITSTATVVANAALDGTIISCTSPPPIVSQSSNLVVVGK